MDIGNKGELVKTSLTVSAASYCPFFCFLFLSIQVRRYFLESTLLCDAGVSNVLNLEKKLLDVKFRLSLHSLQVLTALKTDVAQNLKMPNLLSRSSHFLDVFRSRSNHDFSKNFMNFKIIKFIATTHKKLSK